MVNSISDIRSAEYCKFITSTFMGRNLFMISACKANEDNELVFGYECMHCKYGRAGFMLQFIGSPCVCGLCIDYKQPCEEYA